MKIKELYNINKYAICVKNLINNIIIFTLNSVSSAVNLIMKKDTKNVIYQEELLY